jgi:uncharacterized protein YjcR
MGRKIDENKKEMAFALYMQGEQNKSISQRVGVSEKTIGEWSERFGWKERRAAVQVSRPEIVNQLLKKVSDMVSENKLDADKLSKIASAIEKIEKKDNLFNYIQSFMDFGQWANKLVGTELSSDDLKMIVRLQDRFIQEKL